MQPGNKALDPAYVVETDRWIRDLKRDLGASLRPLAKRQARRSASDLSRVGALADMHARGLGNPRGRTHLDKVSTDPDLMIEVALQPILKMAVDAAQRQSQRVADKVREMDEEGADLKDIKKQVRDMIGARGSWRRGLAIHSATALLEGVKNAVYAEAGPLVDRRWNTQRDENVRKSHDDARGQRQRAGSPFTVGGYPLLYPGDPTAPIEETANCRCYLTYSVKD